MKISFSLTPLLPVNLILLGTLDLLLVGACNTIEITLPSLWLPKHDPPPYTPLWLQHSPFSPLGWELSSVTLPGQARRAPSTAPPLSPGERHTRLDAHCGQWNIAGAWNSPLVCCLGHLQQQYCDSLNTSPSPSINSKLKVLFTIKSRTWRIFISANKKHLLHPNLWSQDLKGSITDYTILKLKKYWFIADKVNLSWAQPCSHNRN